MKSIRLISKRLTWILIFTFGFIPIGTHASAGVLLCIESDGHVSVELAQGLKCASDLLAEEILNDEDHSIEHFSEDQTHCVDCIDIVLKGATDADCTSFVSPKPSEAPAASVSVLAVPNIQDRVLFETCAHDAGVHINSQGILAQLSTVVILN